MEYILGGLIGWIIGGGMGAVLMVIMVAASNADKKLEEMER